MRELTTTTTNITIDGKRLRLDRSADRHLGWLPIEAKLWERRKACARCERLTRWAGLWWCGTPVLVRLVKMLGWIIGIPIGPYSPVSGEPISTPGCGCCLNLKWNMIIHPRWRILRAWQWLVGWITGDCVDRHQIVVHGGCPLGKWPSICV